MQDSYRQFAVIQDSKLQYCKIAPGKLQYCKEALRKLQCCNIVNCTLISQQIDVQNVQKVLLSWQIGACVLEISLDIRI